MNQVVGSKTAGYIYIKNQVLKVAIYLPERELNEQIILDYLIEWAESNYEAALDAIWLSKRTGINYEEINFAVKELERDGLVVLIRYENNDPYTFNRIKITQEGKLYKSSNKHSALSFLDIFTETQNVSPHDAKSFMDLLEDLPERKIQDTLVDSLREKNATNCRNREADTVLEVADLEHFSLKVKCRQSTFAAVVKARKGKKAKINFETISHQIVRAYNRTSPDYILLVVTTEYS